MKKYQEFRKIKEKEKKFVEKTLSKISIEALTALNKLGRQLYISVENENFVYQYPKIYLVSIQLTELIELKDQKVKENIVSAGLYFGFIKNDQFYLSLEGAEFLFNQKAFSEKNILRVSDEGEKSILYGNNILKKMVEKVPPSLKKTDFLLDFNCSNELIGIALSYLDYEVFQNADPESIIALNLIDKGYYLRKKQ